MRHVVKKKGKRYVYDVVNVRLSTRYARILEWIIKESGKPRADIVHEMLLWQFNKVCNEKYKNQEQCSQKLIAMLSGGDNE